MLNNLGLTRFARTLERLCLRQNFITSLDPEIFHELTELDELDLYDNKIKDVGDALIKSTKLR
jgi:protein phosphatase 1 regulatory subunit 7